MARFVFFCRQNSTSKICLNVVFFSVFPITKTIPNSAGVPLTYYHPYGYSDMSVEKLTLKFLEIPFNTKIEVEKFAYQKNGFLSGLTLTEVFKNKYTSISGEKLQVRAMKAEDIYIATGLSSMKVNLKMNLYDEKFNKLFVSGGNYFIASEYESYDLWYVHSNGMTNHLSQELGIRPIVSLCTTTKAKNKNMIGAWNIEI